MIYLTGFKTFAFVLAVSQLHSLEGLFRIPDTYIELVSRSKYWLQGSGAMISIYIVSLIVRIWGGF